MVTDSIKSERATRPGGRSAHVQAQVRAAVEALVAEKGPDQVTVPLVAERAGVSASSVYRRWGDLSGLLAETATRRLVPNRPLPNTGSLRKDLKAWARELSDHLSQPCASSLLKAAAALGPNERTDCLRRRKIEAQMLVAQAKARGEVVPDARQVIDHIVGPIVFSLLFGGPVPTRATADRLVDELLALTVAA